MNGLRILLLAAAVGIGSVLHAMEVTSDDDCLTEQEKKQLVTEFLQHAVEPSEIADGNQTQLQELQNRLQALQDSFDMTRASLEAQLKAATDTRNKVEKEKLDALCNANKLIDDLKVQLNKSQADAQNLQNELNDARADLDRENRILENLKNTFNKYPVEIEGLQKQLNDAHGRIKGQEDEKEELRTRLNGAIDESKRLAGFLATAQKSEAGLRTERDQEIGQHIQTKVEAINTLKRWKNIAYGSMVVAIVGAAVAAYQWYQARGYSTSPSADGKTAVAT